MWIAAASAIAIDWLAREDARVSGIVGVGRKAGSRLRAFKKVIARNLHPGLLPKLGATAADLGLPFEAVMLERMVEADVIVTITSSPAPGLMASPVSPGTHLSCMRNDTKGRQEVDPALVAAASVFTDEVTQSVSIG